MITTAQQAALEQSNVRVIYFASFDFASGMQRLSSANITINWGGYDWLGLGGLGGISAVQESEGLESKPLTFTLNIAQLSWLSEGVGPVDDYRGRSAKLYMCPLDENFQPIDTPQMCWSGIMDVMLVGIDGEEGSVQLKCETAAYGLKRRPALRLNAAQLRKRHPGAAGCDYLNDLIANPQMWLSKRFQQI